MKQNVFSFLILLLLTVACSSSKNVTAADVNVDMVIDMQSMQPLNTQWEYIEPIYRLEIHGNEVISFLPYVWGRSIEKEKTMDMLDFTAKMRKYSSSVDRYGHKTYHFTVQQLAYYFHFDISINKQGTALVEISSDNCDPISFEGKVR